MSINCYKKSKYLYCVEENDGTYIYNRYSKTACNIGKNEWKILQQLDGTKTVDEIAEELNDGLTCKEIAVLINIFSKIGLIDGYEKKPKNNILRYKLGLFNPNKFINSSSQILSVFVFVILICPIPVFIAGIINVNFNLLYRNMLNCINIKAGVIYFVFTIGFLTLHELGHALVAKKFGAKVVEVGLMLYMFVPFVYVTIGGMSKLKSKMIHVLISFSGIMVNLLFCGLSLLLISHAKSGYSNLLYIEILLINGSQILVNMDVFFKVDSYYALSCILDEPKLYDKSINFMKNKFREGALSLDNWLYGLYGSLAIANLIVVPIIIIASLQYLLKFLKLI